MVDGGGDEPPTRVVNVTVFHFFSYRYIKGPQRGIPVSSFRTPHVRIF